MKIALIGGHLTPALAFTDYLLKHTKHTAVFFGRLYSKSGKKQESVEKSEVEKRGVKFVSFDSGKIGQQNFLVLIASLLKTFLAIFRAFALLGREKPEVIVSFGGYLAVPIAIAGWLLRIPVVTHEQTYSAGFANKFISTFSKKIAISHASSKKHFPSRKTVLTGNILRPSVLEKNTNSPDWYTLAIHKPILYITGGSQGSEIINSVVQQALKELTQDWIVIHQCGNPTTTRNYQKELEQKKRSLGKKYRSHYIIRPWLSEEELSWVYTKTSGIVSRAGANTVDEIVARNVPALFVPLPFSHQDEQLNNALSLVDKKAALLLEQKNLSPEALLTSVAQLKRSGESIRRRLKHFSPPENAPKKLLELIENL